MFSENRCNINSTYLVTPPWIYFPWCQICGVFLVLVTKWVRWLTNDTNNSFHFCPTDNRNRYIPTLSYRISKLSTTKEEKKKKNVGDYQHLIEIRRWLCYYIYARPNCGFSWIYGKFVDYFLNYLFIRKNTNLHKYLQSVRRKRLIFNLCQFPSIIISCTCDRCSKVIKRWPSINSCPLKQHKLSTYWKQFGRFNHDVSNLVAMRIVLESLLWSDSHRGFRLRKKQLTRMLPVWLIIQPWHDSRKPI